MVERLRITIWSEEKKKIFGENLKRLNCSNLVLFQEQAMVLLQGLCTCFTEEYAKEKVSDVK
jgi:hypothetical protein